MAEPRFKFYNPGPTKTYPLATAFRKTEPVKVSGLFTGDSEAKEARQGSGSVGSYEETVRAADGSLGRTPLLSSGLTTASGPCPVPIPFPLSVVCDVRSTHHF